MYITRTVNIINPIVTKSPADSENPRRPQRRPHPGPPLGHLGDSERAPVGPHDGDRVEAPLVGEVAMGRPKLYDEDLKAVSARLPKSRAAAVEAGARRRGESKSDF